VTCAVFDLLAEIIFTLLLRNGAQSPGNCALSSRLTRNRSAAGASGAAG
jgi:hypothetical protein